MNAATITSAQRADLRRLLRIPGADPVPPGTCVVLRGSRRVAVVSYAVSISDPPTWAYHLRLGRFVMFPVFADEFRCV